MRLQLVISGGQSGADLAGVEYFRRIGFVTGINSFEHFEEYLYDEEDLDLYRSFDIRHISVPGYPDGIALLRARTHYNVVNSDATIIFVTKPIDKTRGSRLTKRFCVEDNKHFFVFNLFEDPTLQVHRCVEWILGIDPAILNIAGERYCDRQEVISMLHRIWTRVREDEKANVPEMRSRVQNLSVQR